MGPHTFLELQRPPEGGTVRQGSCGPMARWLAPSWRGRGRGRRGAFQGRMLWAEIWTLGRHARGRKPGGGRSARSQLGAPAPVREAQDPGGGRGALWAGGWEGEGEGSGLCEVGALWGEGFGPSGRLRSLFVEGEGMQNPPLFPAGWSAGTCPASTWPAPGAEEVWVSLSGSSRPALPFWECLRLWVPGEVSRPPGVSCPPPPGPLPTLGRLRRLEPSQGEPLRGAGLGVSWRREPAGCLGASDAERRAGPRGSAPRDAAAPRAPAPAQPVGDRAAGPLRAGVPLPACGRSAPAPGAGADTGGRAGAGGWESVQGGGEGRPRSKGATGTLAQQRGWGAGAAGAQGGVRAPG